MKTSKKIEQRMLSKPKVKLKIRVSNAGTQTVNSDFKVKIQTRAATQTGEFEYLFKATVVQPSTAGRGCGFTLVCLVLMYRFVSPFVNQKSKTLILFQDFFGVLDKLRLIVPLQVLAFWFGHLFQLFQGHLLHA